jgi:molecular chaperone HscA
VAMKASPELLTDEDRTAIAGAEQAVEAASAGADHLAIRAAVEALDAASKPFAQRRMDRALETGLRGKALEEVESKVEETAHKGHAGHEHAHAGRR